MIDRFGCKQIYVAGSLGIATALAVLTLISQMSHFRGGIVLALILTYLAFFASCIGPVF